MKTSKAVTLLLLGSVSATERDAAVQGYSYPVVTAQGSADISSLMTSVPQDSYQVITDIIETAGGGASLGNDECVKCIRSKDMTGVWCSSSWNYEFQDSVNSFPSVAAFHVDDNDGGACCYSHANIVKWFTADDDDTAELSQDSGGMNKTVCPAKFQELAVTTQNSNIATKDEAWWCSDGTFNAVASASQGTPSLILAESFGKAGAAAPNGATAAGHIISKDDDRRLDLMVAQCRQLKSVCQASQVDLVTSGTETKTITKNKFNKDHKCTYVAKTVLKGLTFQIITDDISKGLDEKYDVHYQEWIDGWEMKLNEDFQDLVVRDNAANDARAGGVPFAHAKSAKYAQAMKYNYANDNPGKEQEWGEVYNFVNPTDVEYPTTVTAALTTPDTRKKRWFPGQLGLDAAQSARALADSYTTERDAYQAKAVAYNTYLKEVQTQKSRDPITTFFSPPVLPALTERPSVPKQPNQYFGLREWDFSKQQKWKENIATLSADLDYKPTGSEFIFGNDQKGGWGAWTMNRYVGEGASVGLNSIGVQPQHSFGKLGWSIAADLTPQLQSYVKSWDKGHTDPANNEQLDSWANVMCTIDSDTLLSYPCFLQGVSGSEASVINTANIYLAVSVWANANDAAAWDADLGLSIKFSETNWGSLKDDTLKAYKFQGPDDTKGVYPNLLQPLGASALTVSAASLVVMLSFVN